MTTAERRKSPAKQVGRCVYCAQRVMKEADDRLRCVRPDGHPECTLGPVVYTGIDQLVGLGLLPPPAVAS